MTLQRLPDKLLDYHQIIGFATHSVEYLHVDGGVRKIPFVTFSMGKIKREGENHLGTFASPEIAKEITDILLPKFLVDIKALGHDGDTILWRRQMTIEPDSTYFDRVYGFIATARLAVVDSKQVKRFLHPEV